MKKISVSFKDTEMYLYVHLLSKRGKSNYIKDLIEADIKKGESK